MIINGESYALESLSLAEYLRDHGLQIELIAVEVNGKIMPKDTLATLEFSSDDVVEIVSFVGGG